MKIKYIAADGTIFNDMEECKEYERTSPEAAEALFKKLNLQETRHASESDPCGIFAYDDTIHAVKIENADCLEIVNNWLRNMGGCEIDASEIGTIQLFQTKEDWINALGTPADLKEDYCNAIDLFYNKLI